MGHSLAEKILQVSDLAGGVTEIVVFTENFKIHGTLVKDRHEVIKHILTLKNASICGHFDGCSCSSNGPKYEWLNIAEEKITAFSILGYMVCKN